MPSPSGKLPSYRLHRSSKRAVVTINGRDIYLGPHNSKTSIREYDRVIAEYLASGRSPNFGRESESMTIAMLMADYLRHSKTYYGTKATSEFHRIKLALRPLRDLYPTYAAAEFGPTQLKAVRQKMLDTESSRKYTDAKPSRSYINANVKRIVRMFKWAAGEGKIPAAIYDTLRLVPSLKRGRTDAAEPDPIRPVDDDTVNATLPYLSPIVADMVRVQRLIGCRPGEVCNLTPDSFDRSGETWIATLMEHKTQHHGHTRKLFVGPKAQAILLPYLERDGNAPLFCPSEAVALRQRLDSEKRTTPLSCGNRTGKRSGGLRGNKAKKSPGAAYTTASYRRAIHNACDKAFPAPAPLGQRPGESDSARKRRLTPEQLEELKAWQSDRRWSPNRLRHSRGTEVRKAFGLEAAQVILGHQNAKITETYAERDESLAKEVARATG